MGPDVMWTTGNYSEEQFAEFDFDRWVKEKGYFTMLKEVEGRYQGYAKDKCGVRIDRILIPSEKLLKMGWDYGPIGVEIKKSQVRLGKVISQMIDYTHSEFYDTSTLLPIKLRLVFAFPCDSGLGGTIGSICSQNKVGLAYIDSYGALHLDVTVGGTFARLGSQWKNDHIQKGVNVGMKVGSR